MPLTQVPVAGYELQLTPSHGWLKFLWLDTSCCLLCPMTDLSFDSWIQVTAYSILWLTWAPGAGYNFTLIPPCDRLKLWQLDTSCSWFYPVADLSSTGWTWLTVVLYFMFVSAIFTIFKRTMFFLVISNKMIWKEI